jgi:chorismate mutase
MVNSVDSKEKKLEKWRQKIDALDIKIQNDLNQRARYALEIGKIKRAHQMPIYCPQRKKMLSAILFRTTVARFLTRL